MNLSELFVRRPIMTTLVMVGIIIFGLMSYGSLPISDLPSVDYPTIQVSASRPGASPETMAASVARPLEKQFSSIAGLDSLNSTSTLGSTQITLQFNLSRSIDDAAQDVESAIASAAGQIPNDLPNPPTYSKVNPADQPILYLYLDSPTLQLSEVDNYAQTFLAQKLSTINGVAQVQVYGSQKYAVRIQLDPQQLAVRHIGLEQVQTAVQQGNVNLPTGSLSGDHKNFTVQTNGQLQDAAAYRKLIVAYKDGSPIYLEQLGRVIDSVENDKVASWYNNNRAIILSIQRQPGTNTVQVVDTIKKMLPDLSSQIPASVEIGILYDAAQSIRNSVDDVKFTLVLTMQYVPQLVDKLKGLPELQDVNSDLQMTSQVKVNIDRDKGSLYGVSASQIESTLRNAYGGYQVSTIYAATNEYQVILELQPQYQQDTNALLELYVNSSTGQSVPLKAFATIEPSVTPLMVNHAGRMNAATISYNLAPGVALLTANQEITSLVNSIIPNSITTNFQGASQVFQSSLPNLLLLLLIAILVIYLILGILYEDFIHPMTILSGLPSAGFGALLTLMFFHVELNVYSFIGIILLVGIVKKNGIMMLDFAIEAQRNEGKKPSEAIYEACLVRFRPIMMTTMAALMGTLPIALGFGAGSETRRPLGIAVVGGLIFSQILTLYLTPVFYIYMEAIRNSKFKIQNSKFKNNIYKPSFMKF